MTNLPSNIYVLSITLFFVTVIVPAFAQNAGIALPLDVIPETQAEGVVLSRENYPPTPLSPNARAPADKHTPLIHVATLGDLEESATGLEPGFGEAIWDNTKLETLIPLLSTMPTNKTIAAIHQSEYQLLRGIAKGPTGQANNRNWFAIRLARLLAMGDAPAVIALAKMTGAMARDAYSARYLIEAYLAVNQIDTACAVAVPESYTKSAPELTHFFLQFQIYCQLYEQNYDVAALTLDLYRDEIELTDLFYNVAFILSARGTSFSEVTRDNLPPRIRILLYHILRLADYDLPENLELYPAALLPTLARDDYATIEFRLRAARRAITLGLADYDLLLSIIPASDAISETQPLTEHAADMQDVEDTIALKEEENALDSQTSDVEIEDIPEDAIVPPAPIAENATYEPPSFRGFIMQLHAIQTATNEAERHNKIAQALAYAAQYEPIEAGIWEFAALSLAKDIRSLRPNILTAPYADLFILALLTIGDLPTSEIWLASASEPVQLLRTHMNAMRYNFIAAADAFHAHMRNHMRDDADIIFTPYEMADNAAVINQVLTEAVPYVSDKERLEYIYRLGARNGFGTMLLQLISDYRYRTFTNWSDEEHIIAIAALQKASLDEQAIQLAGNITADIFKPDIAALRTNIYAAFTMSDTQNNAADKPDIYIEYYEEEALYDTESAPAAIESLYDTDTE